MRPTLPSTIGQICLVIIGLAVCSGCHSDPPPVTPGEPIPAPAEIVVDTMDIECNDLVEALLKYGDCPNNDEDDKAWAQRVAETAQQSFEAGKKGKPDAPSQHVIALACHKAMLSMKHATERCANGKRPRVD